MSRRVYEMMRLNINGRQIKRVVIDPHFEVKHIGSMNDGIILSLVSLLDGRDFRPIAVDDDKRFEYFLNDGLKLNGKFYRLVWLLPYHESYVGVINAFRR
jgi:hypothetical protein